MDAIQLSLPIPTSVDEMYIDQAMHLEEGMGFSCFAAYTPYGIRQIDSDFCRRIQNIERDPKGAKREIFVDYLIEKKRSQKDCYWHKESKLNRLRMIREETWKKLSHVGEDPKKLKDEILDNPHLHACIKQNLIENLDRILAEMGLNTEVNYHGHKARGLYLTHRGNINQELSTHD
jgi:hypothetical protein